MIPEVTLTACISVLLDSKNNTALIQYCQCTAVRVCVGVHLPNIQILN